MIKKYKKIGALLLGLSCLTGGFFTPVETYAGFFTRKGDKSPFTHTKALENYCKKLVANMTTKELFNVVYGVLREKSSEMIFVYYTEAYGRKSGSNIPSEPLYTITFAMPPQSADDYGLITIRYNQLIGYRDESGGKYDKKLEGEVLLYGYTNFYIDKGSSGDMSVLKIEKYFDIIRIWSNKNFYGNDIYETAVGEGQLIDIREEKKAPYGYAYMEEINDIIYDAVAEKVKKESSSAPSRSKER